MGEDTSSGPTDHQSALRFGRCKTGVPQGEGLGTEKEEIKYGQSDG